MFLIQFVLAFDMVNINIYIYIYIYINGNIFIYILSLFYYNYYIIRDNFKKLDGREDKTEKGLEKS